MIPRTVMVPVGELRVSSNPAEELVTCVGSCVGVAVCDRDAGVAGLLHAVLPERPRLVSPDYPDAYYADSGVRLLVQELLRHGASRRSLSATVAGGASLLSGQTSAEFVGTRNTAKAFDLLREEGIPAEGEEVGGRLGRRVELRVATGGVAVTRISRPVLRTDEPGPAPAPRKIEGLAVRVASLGPNPAAAGRLLEAVHRPSIDWGEVGEVAARDLVLALQILRLANSGAYGRPAQIGSLEAALAVLGPAQVRRICVIAAAARNAAVSLADVGNLEPALRHHCLAAALISWRLTAQRSGGFRREAFAACLLHGVGEVAAGLMPETADGAPGGETAGELGAVLLAEWNFPERIVEAVRVHRAAQEKEGEPVLAAVVGASCGTAHLLGVPCAAHPDGLTLPAPALELLGGAKSADELILAMLGDLRKAGLLGDDRGNVAPRSRIAVDPDLPSWSP